MTTEPEVLVAPQEIHELLSRLTEYRVDSLAIDVPRTLAGLAANTGIPVSRLQAELDAMRGKKKVPRFWHAAAPLFAIILVAAIAVAAKPKPSPAAPPPVEVIAPVGANLEGLVSLTQVTYGPDNGSQLVDPTFEPSVEMPKGVSAYVTTSNVLWGAGDRLAKALHAPLSSGDEAALRTILSEMLAKERQEATRRKLPLSENRGDPFLSYPGTGFQTLISIESFSGAGGVSLTLPPEGSADDDANRIMKRAVDKVVKQLQGNLRWQASSRLGQAPRG
jgi:hypothetical protein